MKPMTLADLMSGSHHHEQPAQRPLKEAQAATLLEEFARYSQPCPFKPGDIITPRATGPYTYRGEPHIVLEVLAEPILIKTIGDDMSDIVSHLFGQRLDIRVAVMNDDGVVLTFMNESWRHEPYTGPLPSFAS